ncbi:PH domain-containing protein [Amycolatopsis taiwanensis]|uniref:PH domain-containing protein n=1 Tax=Amycolatopsis taiwanensis TaxID=342230 RepID=UPI0004B0F467|nr:PH domain-containing protein [Amycolatopsis taiwanensis]
MTWHRLSPKMLAVHPVQEAVRFLPVLVGVLFIGSKGQGHIWSLAGLGLAIAAGLLRWFTTTYRITPTHVLLRRGLLRRQEMSVPRDRVRSVDLTAHPMQRLLGLSRVVIGTGRSDRTNEGLTLDALDRLDAARLREELLKRSTVDTVEAGTARTGAAIATLSPAWIRFGPFTLSGFATIGVVVGSLANLVNESHLEPDQFGLLRSVIGWLDAMGVATAVAVLAVIAVIVVAVLSAIAYVLAFWNFRLTRGDGTLRVTRGLLTTRSTTIELRRLRGTEISEPLLLRAAGGARCLAITTGLRVGRGAEHGGSVLLPPAPLVEARRVAGEVIGDHDPTTAPLARHGRRARLRRHVRAFAFATVVTGVLLLLWWLAGWSAWQWQVALALFPIGALLAEDRYRNLGHAFIGGRLVFRSGSVLRRRHILASEGVIGWTVRRSFFQRRAGLVTLTATTAAGRQHYSTMDIPATEAITLAEAATPGVLTPFLRSRPGSAARATEAR